MNVTVFPLPSPLAAEEILTAPAGGAQHMIIDCVPHRLINGERYLRITDAAGVTYRFCSTCMLRIQAGTLQVTTYGLYEREDDEREDDERAAATGWGRLEDDDTSRRAECVRRSSGEGEI